MDFAKYTSLEAERVLKELETSSGGLSEDAAKELLKNTGLNQISSHKLEWWQIFLRQFKSPFIYLLLGASFLSIALGELIDGAMIILFVTINSTLGFFQEFRSEQTLKILKKYMSSKTTVLRDNEPKIIGVEMLVPGDIVMIEPGDIIPADLRFIETSDLLIDESVLTGESQEVLKSEAVLANATKDIYKANNIGFCGTTVIRGQGKGIVIATGLNTSYGKVVKLTTQSARESTFEKEIRKFSKFTLYIVLITLVLVMAISYIVKSPSNTAELILFAIALAVSVIPEALPVVTTFSLSLGASTLAKKSVVVKRLSAIEDLGAIEVLCSDKTGTLTENKMSVAEIKAEDKSQTLLYANLASLYSKTERNQGNSAFDIALLATLDEKLKADLGHYKSIVKFPFDPVRKRTSSIVEVHGKYEIITRGSPEEIIGLCKLNDQTKNSYLNWAKALGSSGKRVLVVASKKITKKDISKGLKLESDLKFIGMISFTDPIKASTKEALRKAEELGVQVKVLTGDSKEVAASVAIDIGLVKSMEDVITGDDFEKLTSAKQNEAVEKYHVFARVTPEQKYKIISLLQSKFEVGFLGEGINDAPALKIANVAIVVQGASDVAKEASDIVLLKRSLDVIVDGIKEGRSIFANTSKYITVTMAANFGNFFAVSLVSLIIPFLPMLPLQLLLLNLLSDFPLIAVATDTVDERDVATPTKYNLKEFATTALTLGIVSTFFDFVFFSTFVGQGEDVLRTGWFMGSVITEILFVYSLRSKSFFLRAKLPSAPLVVLSIVATLTAVALPFTSFGRTVFDFVTPSRSMIVSVFLIALTYLLTTEAVKLAYWRVFDKRR